jgi:lipopolysaccharide export system protein LptA
MTTRWTTAWCTLRGAACAALLIGAGFAFSAATPAQAAENTAPHDPLTGFATNPDDPIEIESDSLEVQDQSQEATFIGNVIATQGGMKLHSDRLKATYAKSGGKTNAAQPGGEKTQIREILATGNVHVMSKDDQSADGDWARYIVANRNIYMGDKVVLSQGKNVIRGTKLVIDLNTGKSRIVGGAQAGTAKNGATGRVKALFQPPPKEKK